MSTNPITVNPVQKFRALLPSGSRTFGIIASVNATNNTSTITLQNGDRLVVKGSDHAASDRVLIVDGEIRQKVPTLPFTNITMF